MAPLRSSLLVCAVLAAALAPAPAAAQTAAAGAADTDATLRRAVALRVAGRDAAAADLLAALYARDAAPRVAAQLGLACQALGRWAEAGAHLRAALHAPEDPWVARNLAALEGAYTLVLAHAPEPAAALPPAAAAAPAGDAPRPPPLRALPPPRASAPRRGAPPAAAALLAVGGGLALADGGAWLARELVALGFNDRGCRAGDPQPAAGCDAAATQRALDGLTAAAVAGGALGVGAAVAGVVLLVARPAAAPPRAAAVACAPTPGGAACGVVF